MVNGYIWKHVFIGSAPWGPKILGNVSNNDWPQNIGIYLTNKQVWLWPCKALCIVESGSYSINTACGPKYMSHDTYISFLQECKSKPCSKFSKNIQTDTQTKKTGKKSYEVNPTIETVYVYRFRLNSSFFTVFCIFFWQNDQQIDRPTDWPTNRFALIFVSISIFKFEIKSLILF